MSEPNPREVVTSVLPKSWSQNKKDTLADEVLEALDNAGFLSEEPYTTVSLQDALMPVQTVEAFGLRIALDATGAASAISSDRGLVVIA